MTRYFCGCHRRVFRESRRIANVYGYNARMFAEIIRELLECDSPGNIDFLGSTPDEYRGLLDSLDD